MSHQKKADEPKRGNRLGFLFFGIAVKTVGLRATYGLLYFVALYYLLIDRAVVEASLAYIKRRFPDHGTVRQVFDVYRLFVSQGKHLVDRYAMASGYGGIEMELEVRKKLEILWLGRTRGSFVDRSCGKLASCDDGAPEIWENRLSDDATRR